jgi:hypothetical protein
MAIIKVLDISTINLRTSTINDPGIPHVKADEAWGRIFWVPEPFQVEDGTPHDLRLAFAQAHKEGGDWVSADCDADPHPNLLEYPWE